MKEKPKNVVTLPTQFPSAVQLTEEEDGFWSGRVLFLGHEFQLALIRVVAKPCLDRELRDEYLAADYQQSPGQLNAQRLENVGQLIPQEDAQQVVTLPGHPGQFVAYLVPAGITGEYP